MKFDQIQFNYLNAFGFYTSDRSTHIRYRWDTYTPRMIFHRDTPNSSEFKFGFNFYSL